MVRRFTGVRFAGVRNEAQMTARNLLVVQGGGPTQVLNTTLAAIVEEAQARGGFDRIYGARRGVSGFLKNEIVDLGRLQAADLAMLRATPGAALGSSRAKLSEQDLAKLPELLGSYEVHDLLFMGGNGTMRGAEVIGRHCREAG